MRYIARTKSLIHFLLIRHFKTFCLLSSFDRIDCRCACVLFLTHSSRQAPRDTQEWDTNDQMFKKLKNMPFFVPEKGEFFCSSCSSLNYYNFCPVYDSCNCAAHQLYHQKCGLDFGWRRAGFSQDYYMLLYAFCRRTYVIFVLQKHNSLKT